MTPGAIWALPWPAPEKSPRPKIASAKRSICSRTGPRCTATSPPPVCSRRNSLRPNRPYARRFVCAPNHANYLRDLGAILGQSGRTAEAEEAFRAGLRLEPGQSDLHFQLGKLLQKLNRMAGAETCFREATRLKPDNAFFWNALGELLESRNKPADAESAYREARRLNRKSLNA